MSQVFFVSYHVYFHGEAAPVAMGTVTFESRLLLSKDDLDSLVGNLEGDLKKRAEKTLLDQGCEKDLSTLTVHLLSFSPIPMHSSREEDC